MIHLKVIVSPPALQSNSWVGLVLQVWVSSPASSPWLAGSQPLLCLHSRRCTRTRPSRVSRREKSPRLASSQGVFSRRQRRSPTPPGDLPEDAESQTFL